MKKKRLLVLGTTALVSLGLLTSCDYSDFSLFGFFYKIHIDNETKKYDNRGSNDSENSSSSESSEEVKTNIPETYLVTSSETLSNGAKLEKYDLLAILDGSKAALNSYTKYIPTSGSSYTYTSFASLTDYTRDGNVVTLDFGPMVYTDRTDTSNVAFYRGDDETTSKEAFKKAFDTETASFSLKEDGTFALGTTSSGNTAKGLSNATTYWYSEFTSRPSYYMLTLLDDSTYYLNTFCMDSKNDKMPVSAFVTTGTYKTYPDKSTEEYDAVRINPGKGHMYANNNGSNMEFDLPDDSNFKQWLGLSIGSVPAYKVTKVGFAGLLGDVKAYGFEAFSEDFGSDEEKEADPTEGAMLVLDGASNANIKLAFFNDGTYHFVWTANKIDEKGTWVYDKDSDVLTLSATKSDETVRTNVTVKQEDGTYVVNYISAISEQLTQKYVISAADFSAYFQVTKVLELKGDDNEAICITFYSDNTYVFEFKTYNAQEKGTWSYNATTDKLTLNVGDKETGSSSIKGGNYVIYCEHSSGSGLTQSFTMNKDTWGSTFVHALKMLKGEKMEDNCTLTFNSDKTFNFFFKVSNNGTDSIVKEDGTYSVGEDDLVVLKVGDATVATASKEADGRYKFHYVYSKSDQCWQDFMMDEHTYKDVFSISDIAVVGVANPDKTILKLNRDHTYSFNFNFTGSWSKEVGGWEYDSENDKIILTYNTEKTNELAKQEDGSYKGNYTAGISSQLKQEFVIESGNTDFLATTLLNINKENTNGTKFGFIFYSNHSYSFHFYNYGVTEYGTWSYDTTTGDFSFYCNNTVNTASKGTDGSYTFNYISNKNSQMTQEFTFSAEDAAKVIVKA